MSHEDEPTPVWKQELSFHRQEPETPSSPSSWEEELARWSTPQEPARAPEPEPAEPDVAATDGTGALSLDHSWLTRPLEEVSELAPEPVAPPPVEPDVVPVEPIAPVIPLPTPAAELPVELPAQLPADPPAATAAPSLPPLDLEPPFELDEPAPDPEPVAAAPEPEAEPAAKVPFYKREISFGRSKPKGEQQPKEKKEKKRKDEKPKRERKPKVKAEKPPKPEKVGAAEAATEKIPFYKRELSFKRSKANWEPAERPEKPKRAKAQLPSLPRLDLRGGGKGTLVGLKIGASQIAAARVVNNGGPELLQIERAPLEHGVVVGGELRDPEALAVALKEFFKQHNLPRRGIRLGIANNRIGVRTLEVVGIDDPKQLDNAIKFRAQEVLPIPIEDAVLDYQVLAESVDGEGQSSRRVLLVVAYRELVDRYVGACRKAGLQIVGIDLEAFALLRALAEPRPVAANPEGAALVAVAVGHDRTTFAVSDGRICEFTRVLQWGGSSLNIAIARALDSAPSEVEPLKRALSFIGPEELPEGFSHEQLEVARDAARRQLQTFARELVSSLQFYQSQPGSLSIGEIVVTGGTAHLPGLGSELERLVGVPVRVGDPLGRVKVSKKVKDNAQIGSLAVAIGLGIED